MTAFTDRDLDILHRLAGRMIPASAEYGVPGADDAAIFADIVRTLAPAAGTLSPLPARLADAEPDAADPALRPILTAVMLCYYRDDRVLVSLGQEPRPPFPKGFEVEEGDWSLLDPVRARPRLWRDAGRM